MSGTKGGNGLEIKCLPKIGKRKEAQQVKTRNILSPVIKAFNSRQDLFHHFECLFLLYFSKIVLVV